MAAIISANRLSFAPELCLWAESGLNCVDGCLLAAWLVGFLVHCLQLRSCSAPQLSCSAPQFSSAAPCCSLALAEAAAATRLQIVKLRLRFKLCSQQQGS